MYCFFAALLCAVLGVIPLLVRGRIKPAGWQSVISFPILWGLIYWIAPSTVYPLWGWPGFFLLLMWMIAAIMDSTITEDYYGYSELKLTYAAWFPVAGAVIYMISFLGSCGMFRSGEYVNMIGAIEERNWTQDIQPKDPKHMRMRSYENAIYLAKKVIGDAGAIGSQFSISEDHLTLQMIQKELWYVVPLDYSGFSVWTSTNGVPGYVMIHGEDPHRAPIIKMVDKKFLYTPGAYFGENLERYMRNNGYLNKGLAEFQFELDEDYRPWWVISIFKPTIAWSGEKVTEIALVDPVTGSITPYEVDKVPEWVDRVYPADYIKNYLNWHGAYIYGWQNSWWGTKDLTEPENPTLIYASEGYPDFVTGITSRTSNDDSLIGVVYTNSRTGKSVYYKTGGGGTDGAVLDAVKNNKEVNFRKLHGVDPQLYNVYNTMASVVPCLADNHAYQGVAIVNIKDVQKVAFGADQHEALRIYQRILSEGGQQIALDKTRKVEIIDGVIDRIAPDFLSTGTVYYVHLKDVPHLFTGGSSQFSKLPVSEKGDKVTIEFFASGEDVQPMEKFENHSLPLQATRAQNEVKAKSEEKYGEAANIGDLKKQLLEEINNMAPRDIEQIRKVIKKK